MKYQTILLSTAIALSLAACGDSGKQQSQPSASAPAQTYVKAAKDRPFNIPAKLSTTEPCSLDSVNDQPAQDTNSVVDKTKVKFTGWAGNVASGTSPKEVWIELVGSNSAYVKAIRGGKRPDVASYFNKPGLADAGWETYADLSGLAAGDYKVRVNMVDGQQGLTCETKRVIKIN
jgi:hypothetical protein